MVDPYSTEGGDSAELRWQAEADLLAEGRELLERLCSSTRYRYLYPEGPSVALLLEAYQDLDRLRTVGRVAQPRRDASRRSQRRQLRAFKKLLKQAVRRDVIDRNRRLTFRYPAPRLLRLPPAPKVVRRALGQVDTDAAAAVSCHVGGAPDDEGSASTTHGRTHRGLSQFNEALLNAALAAPRLIRSLHPQYFTLLRSPSPLKRRHPIATLLFVKLPLQFMLLVVTLFNLAYIGAYYFFNDEVLGEFVSARVSHITDGDLDMGSIHWDGRLLFDLLTGTPTPVIVQDVTIWAPYKSLGVERSEKIVHTGRVDVTLVLHEIIPWNRMGIPALFEIPWVLDFPEARIVEPVWFDVRQYHAEKSTGEVFRFISLRDAFRPFRPLAPGKGLSFEVGDGRMGPTLLDLDFNETANWRTVVSIDSGEFTLRFDAPDPDVALPERLPFRFNVTASGQEGVLEIKDIEVPIGEFRVDRFACGLESSPLASIGFTGEADAAGSPVHVRGSLTDAMARTVEVAEDGSWTELAKLGDLATVSLDAASPRADGLIAHVLEELELPAHTVEGRRTKATARVWGPLSDPSYALAAQGLTIDALDEPAWAADDVMISLEIARGPPPAVWRDRFAPTDRRRVVRVDTAYGTLFDGHVALRPMGEPATIVFPEDGEPWLMTAAVELTQANPAQLLPDDLNTAATFAGTMSGGVEIERLVLGGTKEDSDEAAGLRRMELKLTDVQLTRDRGPAQDGLPKSIAIDGELVLDESEGIGWDKVVLAVDGGRLRSDGAAGGSAPTLRSTLLDLRVTDGPAFARTFGIPHYVDRVDSQLTVNGPATAPSGGPGSLYVGGAGGGSGEGKIWFDRGTFHARAPAAQLFGGTGSVDIEVGVFKGGRVAKDPQVRAALDLKGVDLGAMVGNGFTGKVDLELEVGDGEGQSAKLSDVRVHGFAQADSFHLAGTNYKDASVSFRLTKDEVSIDQLVLPVHRPVSPLKSPGTTVPVGKIVADGVVSLERDPEVDLLVEAEGVPLDVVARLLEVDAPLRGKIERGTKLTVGGRLSRPKVDGTVALVGLSAAGIPLGSGTLEAKSEDFDRSATFAARRELQVSGELRADPNRRTSGDEIDWALDAVVAFSHPDGEGNPAIAAELDVNFDRIGLPTLLRDPANPRKPPRVHGQLQELSAHLVTCNPGAPMLSACTEVDKSERSLDIDLRVDKVWLRGKPAAKGSDPCRDGSTLCSRDPLVASVHWPLVRLENPWTLGTGGKDPTTLVLSGDFDLGDVAGEAASKVDPLACRPPSVSGGGRRPSAGSPGGSGEARLDGTLDLAAFAPLLSDAGLSTAAGRIKVNLEVKGHALSPRIQGTAQLVRRSGGLEVGVEGVPLPLHFDNLETRIQDGWIAASGDLRLAGETIGFGTVLGEHTGIAMTGPCAGHFGVAAKGAVSSKVISEFAGETVVGGGVDLRRLDVRGHVGDEIQLTRVEGSIGFDDHSLRLELKSGITSIELDSGRVDFQRCQGTCGAMVDDGWIELHLGGIGGSRSNSPPANAVTAKAGLRGRAVAWGHAYLDPRLTAANGTNVQIRMDDVPYRSFDPRGRPVYDGELTSRNLKLSGGEPLQLSGKIEVDRARYIKDAVKGVEILQLAERVDVIEQPPPELISSLQFDVRVETQRPLRVENNVAHGVEADLVVDIAGSFDEPEFTGRFDVEPGGTVDIPFLTGTYEIHRGRVTLLREIQDAEVDVLALRKEPIYIDDTPRQLQLLLGGTLSAVNWTCVAEGDALGQLDSVRGCTEYLVLGAGDVQISESDVQRFGGGGLAGARKPLQVVGHLTEVDFGKRAADAAPRLRPYVPDIHLRLGQIGPEIEIATPPDWFDFNYGRATLGWDYTRGYPGFLLRQSRELKLRLEILDPVSIEFSRRNRTYLNDRIIFDPLLQRTLEFRFDFEIPSLR